MDSTIITLIGFIATLIAVITPIIRLNSSITKLNVTIDNLNTLVGQNGKDIEKINARLQDHELRIDRLERN